MSASGVLLGFLNVALTCAIIVFIAFVILWILGWMGIAVDGNVLKWGKIIVGLLCLIIIVGWLLSLLGGGHGYAPNVLGRW